MVRQSPTDLSDVRLPDRSRKSLSYFKPYGFVVDGMVRARNSNALLPETSVTFAS